MPDPDPDQINLSLTPRELEVVKEALVSFEDRHYGVPMWEDTLKVIGGVVEQVEKIEERLNKSS